MHGKKSQKVKKSREIIPKNKEMFPCFSTFYGGKLRKTNQEAEMNVWYCHLCGKTVIQDGRPNEWCTGGSQPPTMCHYEDIQEVGDQTWYCRKCGLRVKVRGQPHVTHCKGTDLQNWHDWEWDRN